MADEGKEGMAGLCPSEGHAGAAIVCIVEDIGGFKQESDVDYFFFFKIILDFYFWEDETDILFLILSTEYNLKPWT